MMYELIQAGERTWYIDNPNIMGIYQINENDVCLIDTGNGTKAAEKIQEILEGQGWNLRFIINTHTHIDHLGGNDYLMNIWDCPAYATGIENAFANFTDMEAAYMYGGAPCGQLKMIFKHPGPIGFRDIENFDLPEGLEIIELPGHSFGMIGIRTSDDVWFLGDSVLNSKCLAKYQFGYLVDVQGYLDTLDLVENLEGNLFVPAHGDVAADIVPLVKGNRENIRNNADFIRETCGAGISFDNLLKAVYDHYGIPTNLIQQALVGSTLKCYLTWLYDNKQADYYFEDNVMMWKTK